MTVTASTVKGKKFKGWSIDGGKTIISTDEHYTFNATENVTVTAVFEKKGLSGGAIAVISIGSALLALVLLYVIGPILYKKNVISFEICKKLYFYIKK